VVAQAFAQYLNDQELATLGTNLFLSRLPTPSKDNQWAVLAEGGNPPTGGNFLQWRKTYNVRVLYRHKSGEALYNADAALQVATNALTELEGRPVLSLGLSPMSDTDTDAEGRHTASWLVAIETTIN
jgi:hypothetical protein